MPGPYRYLPAVLLATVGVTAAQAAEKSQTVCTSGDLVRRVVIDVGELSTGLPCEVVYWKDKEAPGVRRVLWNARSDAAFCDGKAAGLVDKLASAGWNCDSEGQSLDAAATPAGAGATAGIEPAAPAPATQPSAAPAQTSPALQTPEAAQGTTAGDNVQTAAIPNAEPSDPANLDQLQAVIQSNLSSLNQTVDGDFRAQIGDFGDLNNDGTDDAVVFFNYESSTADFTQFVAAYLYNGQDYHLAATKPVGGTDLAVRQVQVEEIVDGLIQLRLLLNDASQSEDRRAAMILKDGQLVETQ